jgi:hypothetical protein
MAEKYFEKFNRILYRDKLAVNLLQRTTMLTNVMQNPYLFYPFDISNNQRPDQLSDSYYNDEYMSWILYMSNGVIDPYYDWYLSTEELEQYLLKKYNVDTIYKLTQKVKFYRNNWYGSDNLSTSDYEALIVNSPTLLKYWEPVYNGSFKPVYYQRVQQDWIVATNNIVTYVVDNGADFIKDEIVTINFNDTDNHSGRGQVAGFTNTTVIVQHTSGFVIPGADGTITGSSSITGSESGASAIISSGSAFLIDKGRGYDDNGDLILDRLISIDEIEYWSPVYIYDYENELNEKNKSIRVLNSSYAPQMAINLKNLLK